MAILIDVRTKERIFELKCHCGTKGGEVRFPENHGRVSDAALEAEMNALYNHKCDNHADKD